MRLRLLLVTLLAAPSLASGAPRFEASQVWKNPTDDASSCGSLACLQQEMKKSGAAPEAFMAAQRVTAAIAGSYPYPYWVSKFMKYGPVDLVVFACGQCRAGGFAMANGSPSFVKESILVDRLEKYLGQSSLHAQHPRALLQRNVTYLGMERRPGGAERFLFANLVGDCEACAPYAAIKYTFEFDRKGEMIQQNILGTISPKVAEKGVYPPAN